MNHIDQRKIELAQRMVALYGPSRHSLDLSKSLSSDELEQVADNFFEKAKGPAAPIGTQKTFGGRNYIKTADGWKYHGKGGGAKAQEHTAAIQGKPNLQPGHVLMTKDGKAGKISHQDDKHTYIEHQDLKGKTQVSKVATEDVHNKIQSGHYEHHAPAGSGGGEPSASQVANPSKGELSAESQKIAEEKTADIGKRFKAYQMFTNAVIQGKAKSVIAYGTGGVGKTFTATQELKAAGKKEFDGDKHIPGDKDYDFVKITGKMTTPQLYKAMFQHNGKIMLFDDCDSVLRDSNSVNLFKGALDSSGDGSISYGTTTGVKDDEGEKLPNRFKFNGRVIFVSNLTPDEMPQPLKSRGLKVDLSMNKGQTLDRIKDIATDKKTGKMDNLKFPGIDKYSEKDMKNVIDYLDKNKDHVGDLNVRTVGKILGVYQMANEMGEGKDWESYADQELFSKSQSAMYNYDGSEIQKARRMNIAKSYGVDFSKANIEKSELVKSKTVVGAIEGDTIKKAEDDTDLLKAFDNLILD